MTQASFSETVQLSREAMMDLLEKISSAHEHELASYRRSACEPGPPPSEIGGCPSAPDFEPASLLTSPAAGQSDKARTTSKDSKDVAHATSTSCMGSGPGSEFSAASSMGPSLCATQVQTEQVQLGIVPGALEEFHETDGASRISGSMTSMPSSEMVGVQSAPAGSWGLLPLQPDASRSKSDHHPSMMSLHRDSSFLEVPSKLTGKSSATSSSSSSPPFSGGLKIRHASNASNTSNATSIDVQRVSSCSTDRSSIASDATVITVWNGGRQEEARNSTSSWNEVKKSSSMGSSSSMRSSMGIGEAIIFTVPEAYVGRNKSANYGKKPKKNTKMVKPQNEDGPNDQFFEDESTWSGWLNANTTGIVKSPTSPMVLFWGILSVIVVAWDTWTLPLDYAFAPSDRAALDFGQWGTRLYWTMDAIVCCFTGFVDREGKREMRLTKVLRHYMRTWMVIDMFLVWCDWMTFFLDGSKFMSVSQLFRACRLLKLLRMIRILQMTPDLASTMIKFRGHSQRLSFIGGIVKLFVLSGITFHIIACGWFGLSQYMGYGWTWDKEVLCSKGKLCFVQNAEFRVQYSMSYHWAITQVIGSADVAPANAQERIYAIIVLFVSLFISASVVSSITTAMTQLQIITAEKSTQLMLLQQYMTDRNISGKLAIRVQKNAAFVLEEMTKNIREDQVEVLKHISEPLHIELHWEMHGAMLMWHPFFDRYSILNDYASYQICHHAIIQLNAHRGDTLFTAGEQKEHPEMHFVKLGKLFYFRGCDAARILEPGHWAGEPTLWISNWSHVGKLQVVEQSSLICLNSHKTQKIALQFKSVNFWPAAYAQEYCKRLNEVRRDRLTDVEDPEVIDTEVISNLVFEGCEVRAPSMPAASRNSIMSMSGPKKDSGEYKGMRLSTLSGALAGLRSGAGFRRESALPGTSSKHSRQCSPFNTQEVSENSDEEWANAASTGSRSSDGLRTVPGPCIQDPTGPEVQSCQVPELPKQKKRISFADDMEHDGGSRAAPSSNLNSLQEEASPRSSVM